MWFSPISLLSNVRGLIRRAPSSRRLYVVPALARRTNPPTVSHSEKEGKELELNEIGVLRDDPYLALSFLKRIEGNGALPSVQAYATVIRTVCSCGLNQKLNRLLVELIRKGDEGRGFSVEDLLEAIAEAEEEDGEGSSSSQMLRKLCGSLVKAFANLKMFDQIANTYFALKCAPDVKTLNFLMKRMIASGENEMALSVFFHFRSHADPDPNTYVLSVQAYRKVVCRLCNEMEMDDAESFVLQMEKLGIAPDVCVYYAIIQGHRKDMNFLKALLFFNNIVAPRRNKISRVIASSILECVCQMGQFSKAYELFKDFREKKVSLDRVCYNVAFDALVKLGRVEEAIKLFREMSGEGIAPDVANYTTLIGGCCQQEKFEEARDLMIEMDGTVKTPDTVIYNVLARGLARDKKRAEEALGTLKLMEARGLKPTSVTHSMLIQGLIVGGNADKAEALYESLGDEKTRENDFSMVKGYAEAGRPDQAFQRFNGLDFPVPKNVYITLFSSLCAGDKVRAGDKDRAGKAQELLERMSQVIGVEPGKRMYGKLIRAWCRIREMKKARKNFKVLLSCKKIVPDLYTYTSMIKAYCWKEDFKEAYDLFQEMKQRGIIPDAKTYTVLLNNIPDLDMKREMKALGIERDLRYYTVMIDRQCKTGELQDAKRIFDEMVENGVEPDAAPYTALIARCCRDGDVCNADIHMQDMRAKGIEPSQDIINKVELTKSKVSSVVHWSMMNMMQK